MAEHRELTEQELVDWERWAGRDIKWEGRDVARLIFMVRALQARVAKLEKGERSAGFNPPPV